MATNAAVVEGEEAFSGVDTWAVKIGALLFSHFYYFSREGVTDFLL